MIISDLQYIESVDTNASEVQGAGNSSLFFFAPYFSDGESDAIAEAFGRFTDTKAFSETITVPGASTSKSSSRSTSAGGFFLTGKH